MNQWTWQQSLFTSHCDDGRRKTNHHHHQQQQQQQQQQYLHLKTRNTCEWLYMYEAWSRVQYPPENNNKQIKQSEK